MSFLHCSKMSTRKTIQRRFDSDVKEVLSLADLKDIATESDTPETGERQQTERSQNLRELIIPIIL